jgi:glycosyltransferase involved in cell wall biosynthesis
LEAAEGSAMNILIINSAKEWGGTEKWVLYTARGLQELGHTVYFGCRGDLFQKQPLAAGITFVKFPFANNIDLVSVLKLRSFMRKKKIDVCMPSKQREYFLAGIAAKLTPRTKIAGMFAIDRPIHNFRTWIVFCKFFDIVLVNAKKIIDVLGRTKAFDTKKCKVIYFGVEPIERSIEVRARARAALGIGEGDFCIMGIGRLAAQKGFDYAILALALLVKRSPNVKLVIVGGGDQAPFRELATLQGIGDRVVFTGFRTDVHELVQAADLYWLTSRSEGIPCTMQEAMAAKVPVVAFDIAGVGEMVRDGENGYLVAFEDIAGLIEKTVMLIEDPAQRERIAESGYRTMRDDYSMEKMCRETEKCLVELVGKEK